MYDAHVCVCCRLYWRQTGRFCPSVYCTLRTLRTWSVTWPPHWRGSSLIRLQGGSPMLIIGWHTYWTLLFGISMQKGKCSLDSVQMGDEWKYNHNMLCDLYGWMYCTHPCWHCQTLMTSMALWQFVTDLQSSRWNVIFDTLMFHHQDDDSVCANSQMLAC